jgi:cell division transport system permease protein
MKSWSSSWKHIRRTPYQALAAIFIMTQTFFVISLFTFLIYGSARIISYFEAQPQVTAFFKDEAQQTEINALGEDLQQSGKVASLQFVSKAEALKIYKEQNKNDPLLTDLVTEGILPASFEISAVDISDLSSISDVLKKSAIVDQVLYPQDIVANVIRWTDALRQLGLAIIVILALDSIFLMIIIIGIKISQKKEEIEIMRLLSATNWYIRWPFMLEGMFYGIIGALFGWIIAVSTMFSALPTLQSFFGSIPVLAISPTYLFILLGFELAVAVIIGIFSSFLAVLRYLK